MPCQPTSAVVSAAFRGFAWIEQVRLVARPLRLCLVMGNLRDRSYDLIGPAAIEPLSIPKTRCITQIGECLQIGEDRSASFVYLLTLAIIGVVAGLPQY